MEYYNLTASSLASELDIQRSGISHLLSERNKPSLEFVLKLNKKYPEVDILWLTLGQGNFPSQENDLFHYHQEDSLDKSKKNDSIILNNEPVTIQNKEVEKIILFYKDKTFEIFQN